MITQIVQIIIGAVAICIAMILAGLFWYMCEKLDWDIGEMLWKLLIIIAFIASSYWIGGVILECIR